ncbi:MAG: ketopantoate reductase family protein [Deltaproteobacteria bacterium]|nr:ketopantoate reductase family protein [Deltaproteobacteria bacterium]
MADSFSTVEAAKILIAGAGAIGSVFGAMLHAAGHRVTLLGRREHMEAIARGGLRITGLLGTHTILGLNLADRPSQLDGRFDLILCTVKPYDTAALSEDIAERLSEHGVVVSMQNGLGNIEALAGRFGLARVLGGRVIFGSELQRPGAAHVTVFADPVAIGPAPAIHGTLSGVLAGRASEAARLIDRAGVAAVGCADIMPVIWSKLLYNVALNALGALYELSYGELAGDPDLRAIMSEAIGEAFAVARKLEVALPFATASEYLETFYGRLIPATKTHHPTMLYDLKNRGRTDVDWLNGKIVELARQTGLTAPVNQMLVRQVHATERTARSRGAGRQ